MIRLPVIATIAVLAASFALDADATPPTFPLESVRPGMIGIAHTVFSGTAIDTFSVEIVSVVRNIAPKQDMILARALGERMEHLGVAQGMSGSPVFVDGKLLGAMSSTWSFSKEPLLGITPFEQMLSESLTSPQFGLLDPAHHSGSGPFPEGTLAFGAARIADRSTSSPCPIGSPLALTGFDRRLVSLADSLFRDYGVTVIEGGAVGRTDEGGDIRPGATLGVQVVGGDANMTAIGTVTWVEGNQVFGWGHPFFMSGEVEMPLVNGAIHGIIPSHLISFKMGSGGDVLGTIVADRRSGIYGRLGKIPRTVSYNLTVYRGGHVFDSAGAKSDTGKAGTNGAAGSGSAAGQRKPARESSTETYHYDLVRDVNLLPMIVGLVSTNSFLVAGGAIAEETVAFEQSIQLEDGRKTSVRTFFAGDQNAAEISALLSEAVQVIVSNPFEEVEVRQIDATLRIQDDVKMAVITRVAADADTLSPGETLRGRYTLRDWRGQESTRGFSFDIPRTARTGRYLLLVSDGPTAEQFEAERNPRAFGPRSLDELLERIDRLRLTNEVHLLLYRATQGVLIDGTPLPDLPVSTLAVMHGAARSGSAAELPAELVGQTRHDAGRVVQGSHTIRIDVKKEKP